MLTGIDHSFFSVDSIRDDSRMAGCLIANGAGCSLGQVVVV